MAYQPHIVGSVSALGGQAVDDFLEAYVYWREECREVRLGYERWISSGQGERELAYAGYVAALDREEHAARTYEQHAEQVRTISTRDVVAAARWLPS
ncbi:MAG TPA: hypothetical protein VGY32_14450 [Solirubrobacteraceae bacterium]|jgi:hypothetical protein|nr:hypothetical protein [Solirubrobacteraceae bacterium]